MTAEEWPANEEWRAIDGFDEYYEVSDRGRIRTWKAKGARKPIRRASEPHLMHPAPNKNGYMQTSLHHAGSKRVAPIHTLVAEVFLGPRSEGEVVRHLDGNQVNNHLSNLQYGTRAENAADAFRHGTFPLGEVNGKSKLKVDQVHEIRRMLADGGSQRGVAATFGVSRGAISAIANGETWRHLDAA